MVTIDLRDPDVVEHTKDIRILKEAGFTDKERGEINVSEN